MLVESVYKDKKYELDTEKIVNFSRLKIGLGIKPSEDIWKAIKQTKRFKIKEVEYLVVQEFDLDDETWFIAGAEPGPQK